MTAIHRIALSLAALVLSLSNVLAYDTPSTDSLLWDWVSLDSAAIATFSPLLSPEQITATRWVSDSVLTHSCLSRHHWWGRGRGFTLQGKRTAQR